MMALRLLLSLHISHFLGHVVRSWDCAKSSVRTRFHMPIIPLITNFPQKIFDQDHFTMRTFRYQSNNVLTMTGPDVAEKESKDPS